MSSSSITHKTIKLSSGYDIPVIGLGTWRSEPNEVANAVEYALKHGYRHIDGAAIYGNEEEVGAGIKASGVPRDQIFVTSKLWNNRHHPDQVEQALNKTLKDLQLDYLDLYLIHWPVAFKAVGDANSTKDPKTGVVQLDVTPIEDTWKAMEKLVSTGKVRSIGVSNFSIEYLERILKIATIKPAVNQIEAHPFLLQPKLHEFHQKHNIIPTAYSSLGNSIYNRAKVIDDPRIIEISKSLNKNPANVILSFLVQIGFVVIPKSVTPSRIDANLDLFELPKDVVDKFWALDENRRYNDPVDWGRDIFGEQGGDDAAYQKALALAKQ